MTKKIASQPSFRSFLSFSILLFAAILSVKLSSATVVETNWTAPQAVTVKKISSMPSSPAGRIAFEDNLDCQIMSYRLNGTSQNVSSCYQATAFGNLDVRSGLINFAGDDTTAVPLTTYGSREILVPWPESGAVLSAYTNSNQGAYIGLYKNILGVTEDRRNLIGQVIEKRVTRPADIQLKNSSGQNLLANFNSLAFSDGGSWLIAEGYDGYFVRINLATLSVRPFAASFSASSGYNQAQVAVTTDGRYVAISNHATQSFKVYDLEKCPTPASPQVCPYQDYWPEIAKQAGKLYHPVHLRFLNNGLLSFTDVISNVDTVYMLAPSAQIASNLDYLAMGDSYTSGEGAYSYKAGTDTADNECHASTKSYPALLVKDLFTDASGKSVACAGAKIDDIIGRPDYVGQVKGGLPLKDRLAADIERVLINFEPGILPQIAFAGRHQPSALTVSIGGNDIGFGNFLKLCAAPHLKRQLTAENDCYATYEDRLEIAETIDAQVPKLTKLYKKLSSASPASTIYVTGYPLIAVDNGKCALNVRLNTSEIALSIEIIKQLNNAVARAAIAAGLSYVDIEDALTGHRLCETSNGSVAMNGVTAGTDGGPTISLGDRSTRIEVLGKESYHPNAYGYELIKQAILVKTDKLKLKTPKPALRPPAATAGEKILSGPKTGRKTKIKQPSKISKQKSVKKGKTLDISLKGKSKGLKPRQPYVISISDGQTPTNLGTFVSTDEGDIEGTLVMLPIVRPGTHEISIIGDDQLGNPTAIVDVITVIDSETDYDGDGQPNETDSCLTIFSSGIDEDKDDIDDACDGSIQIPPVLTPLPTDTFRPSPSPVTPTPATPGPAQAGAGQPKPIVSVIITPDKPVLIKPSEKTSTALTASSSSPSISVRQSQPMTRTASVAALPIASPGTSSQGQTLGLQTTAVPKLPLGSTSNDITEFQQLRRIPWLHYLIIYLVILGLVDLIRRILEKRVGRRLRY